MFAQFGLDIFEDGSKGLAGAAPGGEKVDQYRFAGRNEVLKRGIHFFIKITNTECLPQSIFLESQQVGASVASADVPKPYFGGRAFQDGVVFS